MTTVFVGGSRRVSELSAEVRERLDNIMEGKFAVIIGDASGADKAVQRYLYDKNYQNVEVFCSGGICRNNVGDWQNRSIRSANRAGNAEFYAAKDRVMAQEATVGLMIWDGSSIGTLLNLFRLLRLKKKAVLYIVPEKRFLELRRWTDWEGLLGNMDRGLQNKIVKRTKKEATEENMPSPIVHGLTSVR